MQRLPTVVAVALVVCLFPAVGAGQERDAPSQSSRADAARLPWLSIGGSARVRPESRLATGFARGDDEAYVLTRLRMGVGVETGRWARVFLEGQDARAPGLVPAGTNLSDAVDFYQGYGELGPRDGLVRLRVGRQEMAYGQQRLISVNPWRNTGRSFDAARLLVGTDTLGVDLFASAIVEKQQDALDDWVEGEHLYGAYGRIGAEGATRIEPYVLVRTRSQTARRSLSEDRTSLGVRVTHQVSARLDATGEAVHQRGDRDEESISAWMTYGIVGYELETFPWRPRLEAEYSFASGDTAPGDGRAEGFDTLYNTPHRFYGYADLFGGRNIQDAHAEVTLRPSSALAVVVDVHRLWLATRRDGLYGPSLTPILESPEGGFDTADVGTEIDLTLTYRWRAWLTVSGGWSRFWRGALLETSTTSDSSFTYAAVDVRF